MTRARSPSATWRKRYGALEVLSGVSLEAARAR